MINSSSILTDKFGRKHNYLRISLTERCNLRCTYCMPAEGIALTPRQHLMNADEIYQIAKVFVENGADKIRLTGGEPLVRKDFPEILAKLATLNTTLTLTTNGVLVDRFIEDFKSCGVTTVNVSLDSLHPQKFSRITRRNTFSKAFENIKLLQENGFNVKVNVVLIKGFNDNEIVDFIKLTQTADIAVRFIEFMPFKGNDWDKSKLVTQQDILSKAADFFGYQYLEVLKNEQNFTARAYRISNFKGTFGIISSVTNPFCDSCNRIRLTANGRIKNCLFSNKETDLLNALRSNEPLEPYIYKALVNKQAVRAGMSDFQKLSDPQQHSENRSMLTIGG